jgi:hypothetical protein
VKSYGSKEDIVRKKTKTYMELEFLNFKQGETKIALTDPDAPPRRGHREKPIDIRGIKVVLEGNEGRMYLKFGARCFIPRWHELSRELNRRLRGSGLRAQKAIVLNDYREETYEIRFSGKKGVPFTETATRHCLTLAHRLLVDPYALPVPRVFQETFVRVPRPGDPSGTRIDVPYGEWLAEGLYPERPNLQLIS